MIAVTFALPSESSAFVHLLEGHQPQSIAIFHTGVGEAATRARLPSLLDAEKPHLLISSGFAGALNKVWEPGDLLLAENVSDADLLAAATRSLPQARLGRITSAAAIVDSPAMRHELGKSLRADAVDMESEVIGELCATRGIPMLSLRVISDTPAFPFPAPPSVLFDLERQRTEFARLFLYVAKHPSSVPRFIRFARQISAARSALGDALYLLISSGSLS